MLWPLWLLGMSLKWNHFLSLIKRWQTSEVPSARHCTAWSCLWTGQSDEAISCFEVMGWGFSGLSHEAIPTGRISKLIGKGKNVKRERIKYHYTRLIAYASIGLAAGTWNALMFQWGKQSSRFDGQIKGGLWTFTICRSVVSSQIVASISQPSHLITLEAWAWGLLSVNGGGRGGACLWCSVVSEKAPV